MKMNTTKTDTTPSYLDGIIKGDSKVIRQFYQAFFERIASFVKGNGGSLEDAKDIFQDAIMIIYQKAKQPDFQLNCTLYTYFYAICKNLWFQKLRKQPILASVEDVQIAEEQNILKSLEERSKQKLFFSKFSFLKESCRNILTLFFAKKTMEEIAQELNLGSAGYAKKKKYQCQKKLLELIQADPSFKELYNKNS